MLFAEFNKACKSHGYTSKEEKDEFRADLTRQECGELVSWSALTQKQVDGLLLALLAHTAPDELHVDDAEKRRLIFGIESHGLDHALIAHLAEHTIPGGRGAWRTMDTHHLRNLRMTVANRARSMRQRLTAELVDDLEEFSAAALKKLTDGDFFALIKARFNPDLTALLIAAKNS